jgi:hypothetical protein
VNLIDDGFFGRAPDDRFFLREKVRGADSEYDGEESCQEKRKAPLGEQITPCNA